MVIQFGGILYMVLCSIVVKVHCFVISVVPIIHIFMLSVACIRGWSKRNFFTINTLSGLL
uniref:Uncharacterized protein n=1 Tax=Arundo donax TaxID=35708 RepID=A0A0A9E237_ARUDO